MILDLISKYNLLLRFTSTKKLDAEMIDSLLMMFNIDIPKNLHNRIIDVVDGLSEEKGYTTLLEIVKDEEFIQVVSSLQKDSEEHYQNKGGLKDGRDADLEVPISSVIRCPHCDKLFSLADARGLVDRLEYALEKQEAEMITTST